MLTSDPWRTEIVACPGSDLGFAEQRPNKVKSASARRPRVHTANGVVPMTYVVIP
jgi:hypothetical protein